MVIATRFGSDVRRLGPDNRVDWGARGSRRYVRRAVEGSLRRLRTDWMLTHGALDVMERLETFARKRAISILDVAISSTWLSEDWPHSRRSRR